MYYTDFKHRPVREIAEASESGSATNVIAGLGVGYESTFLPILVVCAAILVSYYLGRTTMHLRDQILRYYMSQCKLCVLRFCS